MTVNSEEVTNYFAVCNKCGDDHYKNSSSVQDALSEAFHDGWSVNDKTKEAICPKCDEGINR